MYFNIERKNLLERLYFIISRKIKNATETHTKKIYVVYTEGAVTDGRGQNWFAKFHTGNFSLDEAPWWGKSVEVGRDQIKTLIENN